MPLICQRCLPPRVHQITAKRGLCELCGRAAIVHEVEVKDLVHGVKQNERSRAEAICQAYSIATQVVDREGEPPDVWFKAVVASTSESIAESITSEEN